MRSVHDWFASYGADHQNPTNRLIHWICVPAILWSVIALIWIVPVPPSIGRPGFWCALLMVGVLTFYWRLSRPLGAAMIVLFIALALLTHVAYGALGPSACSGSRSACSSSRGSASSSGTSSKGGGRRSSPTSPIC